MALNTEESVVAVEAGDGLETDDIATFGGTITLKVDVSEIAGNVLSEDADGNLSLNIGDLLQDDGTGELEVQIGRGLAEDQTGRIEVKYADGEVLEFGTDGDVGLSYNSTRDSLILTNIETGTDQIEFDQETGSMNLSGTLTEGATL